MPWPSTSQRLTEPGAFDRRNLGDILLEHVAVDECGAADRAFAGFTARGPARTGQK